MTANNQVSGMMMRLLRQLFAVVIATALIGAPVQAAIVMPCDAIVTSAPDHALFSDQAPPSTPCGGMMLVCPDMVGCGVTAGLPAHVTGVAHELVWTAAAYWAGAELPHGLSVQPAIDPPITI
jgi:hypothetical protein